MDRHEKSGSMARLANSYSVVKLMLTNLLLSYLNINSNNYEFIEPSKPEVIPLSAQCFIHRGKGACHGQS